MKFTFDKGGYKLDLHFKNIDVWYFDTPVIFKNYPHDIIFLSEMELARSAEIQVDIDRVNYISSRIILRKLLAEKLCQEPSQINLRTNVFGKLFVPSTELDFSLSRSGKNLMIGFSKCSKIGVDLETINTKKPLNPGILNGIFSVNEKQVYQTLDFKDQKTFFYDVWTKKEALLKALGIGISIPLNSIDTCSYIYFKPFYNQRIAKKTWNIINCAKYLPDRNICASIAIEV